MLLNKLTIFVLIISAITLYSCQPNKVEQEVRIPVPESLKIAVVMDTSDYTTSVIPSSNPEAPDVLVIQWKVKITNITQDPATGDTVVVDKIEIIENPYLDEAPYSIDFEGNPNGIYSVAGEVLSLPIILAPYTPITCILKHGQTLDQATMEFLKNRFPDFSNLSSKEVFRALTENGYNLQNNKLLQGEEFQVKLYSIKSNIFVRDILFPYNNYCK
jgi:hypothetical protein